MGTSKGGSLKKMFLGKELRPHSYDSGKPLEGCKEGSGKI